MVVIVVLGAAESEEEVEVVVVRLVAAVDGFWTEVAWRVSLESLGTAAGCFDGV